MTQDERAYVDLLVTAGRATVDVLDRLISRETSKRKLRKLNEYRAQVVADLERCELVS